MHGKVLIQAPLHHKVIVSGQPHTRSDSRQVRRGHRGQLGLLRRESEALGPGQISGGGKAPSQESLLGLAEPHEPGQLAEEPPRPRPLLQQVRQLSRGLRGGGRGGHL